MTKSYVAFAIALIAAGLFCPAAAMNGKAAVVVQYQTGYDWEGQRKCRLVIATIVNNEVTANDTILRTGIGEEIIYPQFSFDGQKIAFARNVTVGGQKRVAVSVIDCNGGNLRDIAYLDMSHAEGSVITHKTSEWVHVDWPKGDWVYYFCGGSGSGDDNGPGFDCLIWRVNVNDTTERYRVANYSADVGRFNLSANGLYCSADPWRATYVDLSLHSAQWYQGPMVHRFPARNIDATLLWDDVATAALNKKEGCNSTLAPSGTIMEHFSGGHNKIDFLFWNHATDEVVDNNQVLGPSSPCTQPQGVGGVCYLEIDKWLNLEQHNLFDANISCANSDRWVLTTVWWGQNHFSGSSFGIAIGWKDKDAVLLTNIPKSELYMEPSGKTYAMVPMYFGDLWVDGGPAAAGKLQDTTGAWVDVDPVGTLVDFHSVNKGGQSYELTMVRSPRNAKIYYTTDGTEPTASSTLYTGPLLYTGGSTKVTIKAKAISTGTPTGWTVTKFVMANASGLQATSTVSYPSRLAAVKSSYVVYDLLGNKIAQGTEFSKRERIPCGMYFVRISENGQSVTRRLSVFSAQQATQLPQ